MQHSRSRVSCRHVEAMLDGLNCCVGSGRVAVSTGAAPGSPDTHPLEVDEAGGPVTAPVEVNGQTVNAILLQPMTAEAATEAAGHQIVAPRYALTYQEHDSMHILPCQHVPQCWHRTNVSRFT